MVSFFHIWTCFANLWCCCFLKTPIRNRQNGLKGWISRLDCFSRNMLDQPTKWDLRGLKWFKDRCSENMTTHTGYNTPSKWIVIQSSSCIFFQPHGVSNRPIMDKRIEFRHIFIQFIKSILLRESAIQLYICHTQISHRLFSYMRIDVDFGCPSPPSQRTKELSHMDSETSVDDSEASSTSCLAGGGLQLHPLRGVLIVFMVQNQGQPVAIGSLSVYPAFFLSVWYIPDGAGFLQNISDCPFGGKWCEACDLPQKHCQPASLFCVVLKIR